MELLLLFDFRVRSYTSSQAFMCDESLSNLRSLPLPYAYNQTHIAVCNLVATVCDLFHISRSVLAVFAFNCAFIRSFEYYCHNVSLQVTI